MDLKLDGPLPATGKNKGHGSHDWSPLLGTLKAITPNPARASTGERLAKIGMAENLH